MTLKLVILFAILLLLIPISSAAYDVVSNISSNSTEYTTSASYGELHNISLATGAGTTFLTASWDARVNFTAPLYGRFLRDGVSFGRFNLTQNVYATVGSYQISFEETAGTHQYGWEVYSNKKGTIYSRNFSAFFLVNGSYGTGAGGGNVSSVTGAPAGVLDCTGTDEITCTITQSTTGASGYLSSTDWNTFNSKITNATAQINRSQVSGQEGVDTTQNTSISNSQSNDTYFNGTVFSQSTEFKNSTAVTANNTANLANTTANNAEPAISQGVSPQFWMFNKTWQNITTTWITEGVNLWFTNARAISAVQNILNAMNASSAANNTASQGRDDAQNISIDANTNTIAGNLAAWNATYNATYDATTTTVNGNLANWNATYNSSYASGGFDVLFTNGSNVLAAGTKAHVKAKYAGTLTDLTARSFETGSINISAYNLTLGTYIGSVVITAGTDGSTTGLSYAFAKGDWLNLTVSSVTDIKQVTAAVQTIKS